MQHHSLDQPRTIDASSFEGSFVASTYDDRVRVQATTLTASAPTQFTNQLAATNETKHWNMKNMNEFEVFMAQYEERRAQIVNQRKENVNIVMGMPGHQLNLVMEDLISAQFPVQMESSNERKVKAVEDLISSLPCMSIS